MLPSYCLPELWWFTQFDDAISQHGAALFCVHRVDGLAQRLAVANDDGALLGARDRGVQQWAFEHDEMCVLDVDDYAFGA